MLVRVLRRVSLGLLDVDPLDVAHREHILHHRQCLTVPLQRDQIAIRVNPAELLGVRSLHHNARVVDEKVQLALALLLRALGTDEEVVELGPQVFGEGGTRLFVSHVVIFMDVRLDTRVLVLLEELGHLEGVLGWVG